MAKIFPKEQRHPELFKEGEEDWFAIVEKYEGIGGPRVKDFFAVFYLNSNGTLGKLYKDGIYHLNDLIQMFRITERDLKNIGEGNVLYVLKR